jgi:hypothetical protein
MASLSTARKVGRTVLPNIRKGTGWRPGIKDARAWRLSRALGDVPRGAPDGVIHLRRELYPRIRDQGQLGSCTGHALRNSMRYLLAERLGERLDGDWGEKWDLSPLAAYWLGRQPQGWQYEDTGAIISDVVLAAREYGIPTEESWPYVPERFTRKPSQKAFTTGRWHQASPACFRCDEDGGNPDAVIYRMAQAIRAGMPLVYGFGCYDNLSESDDTGIVPLPRGRMNGGHAVTGYEMDFRERLVGGPNSWGKWGARAPQGSRHDERGWIWVPFQYFICRWADDVHAIGLEDAPA